MSDSPAHVVALVGSLRQASINRRLVDAVAGAVGPDVVITVAASLDRLPFYNEDIDPDVNPAAAPLDENVVALRELVGGADAVLVATPEYNGSTPAVLKNAIDWLSRPYGTGAIKDKPAGVISAALGRFAGTWSREDTRKSLGIAGAQVVEEVDLGLPTADIGDGELPAEAVAAGVGAVGVLVAGATARV